MYKLKQVLKRLDSCLSDGMLKQIQHDKMIFNLTLHAVFKYEK